MAKKGTSKYLSVQHENHLASLFDGIRSPSSGAASNDAGDVRCPMVLIECKTTGKPGKVKRPAWLEDFEKVTEEAWSEGRDPMMAFQFWDPDSILADQNGYIDLTVRIAKDDAAREKDYVEVRHE
jgi:hypothetical protein